MLRLFLLVSLLIVNAQAILAAAPAYVLTPGVSDSLGLHIDWMSDKHDNYTIEQVRGDPSLPWQTSLQPVINFGFKRETNWFRLKIDNPNKNKEWYFIIASSDHRDLEFYYEDANGTMVKKVAGLMHPFNVRDIKSNQFVFKFTTAERTTLFLRSSGYYSKRYNVLIADEAGFFHYSDRLSYLVAGYYGILSTMLIYNFFLWMTLRKRSSARR